jgi:hypothetical protein
LRAPRKISPLSSVKKHLLNYSEPCEPFEIAFLRQSGHKHDSPSTGITLGNSVHQQCPVLAPHSKSAPQLVHLIFSGSLFIRI